MVGTDSDLIVGLELVLGVAGEQTTLACAGVAYHNYLEHGLVGPRCPAADLHDYLLFILAWANNS